MRVQLSPWEIVETSFHLSSSPSKRRRRAGSSEKATDIRHQIAASFIGETSISQRSRKKKAKKSLKNTSDVRTPLVAITTPHKVTIIVGDSEKQTDKNELEESSFLQFVSRPTKATAFIPDEGSKATNIVPAVFDAEQNVFYALQKDNRKLVCFAADGSDGKKKDSLDTVTSTLNHVALDLQLMHLPRASKDNPPLCLVYGTCEGGSLFIACLKQGQLLVEYIESESQQDTDSHIGTLAHLIVKTGTSTKRKRKMSGVFSEASVCMLYQVSGHKSCVRLLRHKVKINALETAGESSWATITKIPKPSISVDLVEDESDISEVSVLGQVEDQGAVALRFTKRSTPDCNVEGKSTNLLSSFYVLLSLQTGNLMGPSVLLPKNTKQTVMVGSTIVGAMTEQNTIVLFDAVRGGPIFSQSLGASSLLTLDTECILLADAKRARLVLLFSRDGKFSIAYTSVTNDDDTNQFNAMMRGKTMSLAAGLASSLLNDPACTAYKQPSHSFFLASQSSPHTLEVSEEQEAVAIGIRMFETSFGMLRNAANDSMDPSFLLQSYATALTAIGSKTEKPTLLNGTRNPKESILGKSVKVNGVKRSPNAKKKQANGFHIRSDATLKNEQAQLTQALKAAQESNTLSGLFIDSSAKLIISYLCYRKQSENDTFRNDARFILRELVRSRMLSARIHFSSRIDQGVSVSFHDLLQALEYSTRDDGFSEYTPFELAYDIFECCNDVSEYQMIAILNHTTKEALSTDIARGFVRNDAFTDHPFRERAAIFCKQQRNRGQSLDEGDGDKKMNNKVILNGTAALMQRMTEYSRCNTSLLRNAIQRELNQYQVKFFVSFFADMLTTRDKFSGIPRPCGCLQNTVDWLSAFCDCYIRPHERSDISRVLDLVGKEVSKTESILVLGNTLTNALETEKRETEHTDSLVNATTKLPTTSKASKVLGRYQIERLVLSFGGAELSTTPE